MKNWKTTLFGVIVGVTTAIHLIWPATLSTDAAAAIAGAATLALGLSSKDNNVTGGTVAQ